MSGLDKNRFRNKTVAFRVSPDEDLKLNAKVKVSGMPKGEYIISSLLLNKVEIVVGKYQSDRLSLELRRLRDALDGHDAVEQTHDILLECKALLDEMMELAVKRKDDALSPNDFRTEK